MPLTLMIPAATPEKADQIAFYAERHGFEVRMFDEETVLIHLGDMTAGRFEAQFRRALESGDLPAGVSISRVG